jgi:ABC-type multidrug transport system fused ATPase/permease subunit
VFLLLIGGVLEAMSVGFILPILSIFNGNSNLVSNIYINKFIKLKTFSPEKLIIISFVFLFIIFLIKALYLAYLSLRQSSFVFKVQEELSNKFFHHFFRQPYQYFTNRNSSELMRIILNDTSQFTNGGLIPLMTYFTELLVIIGVTTVLFVVEPIGTLVVSTSLIFASFIFYLFTRKKLLSWGRIRQEKDGYKIQNIQESFSSIREIKILNIESFFINKYESNNKESNRVQKWQNYFQQLPRLWLELLSIFGLVILIFIMIIRGEPVSMIVPKLGVFAASAFRIIPSLNRLMGSVQNFRFVDSICDTLIFELYNVVDVNYVHFDNIKNENSFSFKEINILNLGFSYKSSERIVLDSINMKFIKGKCIGIIGDSGSGKSTLINILLGLLEPKSGSVNIDNLNIHDNLNYWHKHIGYVPQNINLIDDTIESNIALGQKKEDIDKDKIINAVKLAKLDGFIEQLENHLDTKVGERGVRFSGGQIQRIGIARALYSDPEILILDEATSALDVKTESEIMDAVFELQGDKTIIIVAHRLSTISRCDYVYLIKNGKVEYEGDYQFVIDKYINI